MIVKSFGQTLRSTRRARDNGTGARLFDPFHLSIDLPRETLVHPLGFPMRLRTNSADVIQAVEESWRGFPHLFDDRSLEVRIAVSDDETAPCASGLRFYGQGHLLTFLSDQNNLAVCDLEKGFTFAWFVPATARNHPFFRAFYFDSITYLPLWHSHLTLIHAGCVARNGRGVLLCGPSGAGKSCLTFACARRGWTLIADEPVSLLRRPPGRTVLGRPWHMHFRETAADLFPEFSGLLASPNAVGKISFEIPIADLPRFQTAFQCQVAAVVFLNRHADDPPRLVPVSATDAFRRLESSLPLVPAPVMEQHHAALRHLVETGAFELRYHDLEQAVTALEPLVDPATNL